MRIFKLSYIILLCISMCTINLSARNKYALLVGLSDYKEESGWNKIHGTNDIDLIKTVLKDYDIHELKNSEATYENIIKELTALTQRCKEGDVVYLHFSGHGQPVEDLNKDEEDGWDESFVPYDAHKRYKEGVYDGSKHLTDDILNIYYMGLSSKIGSEGMMYVVLDACHSGESFRGDVYSDFLVIDGDEVSSKKIFALGEVSVDSEETFERGTSIGFSKTNKNYLVKNEVAKKRCTFPKSKDCSDIIVFESSLSTQNSQEIDVLVNDGKGNTRHFFCGVLSYSIFKTIKSVGLLSSDDSWIDAVSFNFKKIVDGKKRQNLVIERISD